MPRSSKWFLSLRPPLPNPICTTHLTHACRMPSPSHSSFDYLTTWWEETVNRNTTQTFLLPWLSPKASDLTATAPCFNHWLSSSGRFILRNQKKYHTC
jgi:hypothetical protein